MQIVLQHLHSVFCSSFCSPPKPIYQTRTRIRKLAYCTCRMAAARSLTARMPAWYLTHGAGPLPLLGEPGHADMVAHWTTLAATLPSKPTAIVVISGHDKEKFATVSTAAAPPMEYDFYGFPQESYKITYPAPGHPALAQQMIQMIKDAGIKTAEDAKRGYDHGVFVPLKIIFPEADVPVVMLSMMQSFDAQRHIELGEAIAPLREQGVLVIGSGSSWHNMRRIKVSGPGAIDNDSTEWDDWLQDTLAGEGRTPEQRKGLMVKWEKAPSARVAQPEESHLLPLHVALGSAHCGQAKVIFKGPLFGAAISSYQWD